MRSADSRLLDCELRRFLGVALNLGQLALGDDDRFRAFKKALMNDFHENHVKEIRRIVGVHSQGPGSAASDNHDGKDGAP